jgi:hypothetical protein
MPDLEQLQMMISAAEEKLAQSIMINGQNSPKSERLQKYLHLLQIYERKVGRG